MPRFISFDEENPSPEELELVNLVYNITAPYAVDPYCSKEMEEFFQGLLSQYYGDIKELPAWLDEKVQQSFIAINERPRWIQNPDWPMANGKPMIFVAKLDIAKNDLNIYHDDVSFYVFIGENVEPRVVTQIY